MKNSVYPNKATYTNLPVFTSKKASSHCGHQGNYKYWVTWGTCAIAVKVCDNCLQGHYLYMSGVLVEVLEEDIESEVWDQA